jgi:hypothetical protein
VLIIVWEHEDPPKAAERIFDIVKHRSTVPQSAVAFVLLKVVDVSAILTTWQYACSVRK